MQTSEVKEVYGAQIAPEKESPSASRIRSTNLKERHKPEARRPPRKYEIGHIIYLAVEGIPFTNGLIVGYEWGPNCRNRKPKAGDGWAYYVREAESEEGTETYIIGESKISDRISV